MTPSLASKWCDDWFLWWLSLIHPLGSWQESHSSYVSLCEPVIRIFLLGIHSLSMALCWWKGVDNSIMQIPGKERLPYLECHPEVTICVTRYIDPCLIASRSPFTVKKKTYKLWSIWMLASFSHIVPLSLNNSCQPLMINSSNWIVSEFSNLLF
jgi:hypothetical protein